MTKIMLVVLLLVVALVGVWDSKTGAPTRTQNDVVDNATMTLPQKEIKNMLRQEAGTLNNDVINKTLMALHCAEENNIDHNNILTIIDYSLPSSEKRLWVFDLEKKKLLFHTYVSHGLKSGALLSQYFSNKINSKASSLGVYNTEKPYRGRHGASLKLQGLDKGFNDNAYNRFIVMHGSWYVDEAFIKKYGRAGRSWGCPTVPRDLIHPIIDTIKENSFLIVYYPGDRWLENSTFLNCRSFASQPHVANGTVESNTPIEDARGEILFADINNNNQHEENEPVAVIQADHYQKIFNKKAPLKRMLRRQINNTEYIALNYEEFNVLHNENKTYLASIYFVIPIVKMDRGYYATEMKIVTLGKIKNLRLNKILSEENEKIENYILNFEEKSPINLKATERFIRWLGL